jgi:hypothetical protein
MNCEHTKEWQDCEACDGRGSLTWGDDERVACTACFGVGYREVCELPCLVGEQRERRAAARRAYA